MSSLSLPFSFFLFSFQCALFRGLPLGGDEQIRTVDPLLARQVLSHLSYTPIPIALASSSLAKAVSQVLQSAPHL